VTKNVAIIFAGGVGSRMGNSALPKQYIEVGGKPILIWTLECFQNHPSIDEIYIACLENWIEQTYILTSEFRIDKVKAIVPGGITAQHSIYNALQAARFDNSGDTLVLIHDGVRPFITDRLIDDLLDTARQSGSAIPYTPCQETIVISESGASLDSVPIRRQTFSVQAPQVFFIDDILAAHDEVRQSKPDYLDLVDSCTIYSTLGKSISLVRGNIGNIKITRPEDVFILKGLMEYRESEKILGLSLLDME
jgi:2-C-methyl-D-erythritol 4-phosphate cytidylyltransferase